jgi:hypothetical protein
MLRGSYGAAARSVGASSSQCADSKAKRVISRLSPLPDVVGPASETPGTHSGQRLRSVRQPKSAAGDASTVIRARKW